MRDDNIYTTKQPMEKFITIAPHVLKILHNQDFNRAPATLLHWASLSSLSYLGV